MNERTRKQTHLHLEQLHVRIEGYKDPMKTVLIYSLDMNETKHATTESTISEFNLKRAWHLCYILHTELTELFLHYLTWSIDSRCGFVKSEVASQHFPGRSFRDDDKILSKAGSLETFQSGNKHGY